MTIINRTKQTINGIHYIRCMHEYDFISKIVAENIREILLSMF